MGANRMKKLITIVVALLLLTGCSVVPQQWAEAEKTCASNGGISYMYGSISLTAIEVKCNNGAYFDYRIKR